jgi:hypothetical protein
MIEIPERDWLTVGFVWMALGFVASMPPISHSWLGHVARLILDLTVVVHVAEAFYAFTLAQRAGLDGGPWFWKTLFLGYFGWRKIANLPPAAPHAS